MVVRLRLARFGRKHKPSYRIVAADSRCPRDGRHLEQLGSYDPIPRRDGTKEIRLKTERLKYWLSVGAQPSKRVELLLSMAELIPKGPQRQPTIKNIPKAQRNYSTSSVGVIGAGFMQGSIIVPFASRIPWIN